MAFFPRRRNAERVWVRRRTLELEKPISVTVEDHIIGSNAVSPIWRSKGGFRKQHAVLGLRGESVVDPSGESAQPTARVSVRLANGDQISVENAPFGVLRLSDGRRVLYSVHPRMGKDLGENELTILVHGVVPGRTEPFIEEHEIHAPYKLISPGSHGSARVRSTKIVVQSTGHHVEPLSPEDAELVSMELERRVLQDILSDKRAASERVWQAVARAAEKTLNAIPHDCDERYAAPTSRTNASTHRARRGVQLDVLLSQSGAERILDRLVSDSGEDRLPTLLHPVASFQKEVNLALGGVKDIKERVMGISLDPVAKNKLIGLKNAYLAALRRAKENGKLKIRIVHRTG